MYVLLFISHYSANCTPVKCRSACQSSDQKAAVTMPFVGECVRKAIGASYCVYLKLSEDDCWHR